MRLILTRRMWDGSNKKKPQKRKLKKIDDDPPKQPDTCDGGA